MRKFIILISFLVITIATAKCQENVIKKCKTCGKPIKECYYKGEHPIESTPSSNTTDTKRTDVNDLLFSIGGVVFKMVYVEGGSFLMGSPDSDGNANSDEKPQHTVVLYGFYVGETEVTQALWKAVMGSVTSTYSGSNKPVESKSFNDCKDFVRKLRALTGYMFRLPTEAEWEYAARGGNKSRGYKYSGGNDICDVGWYGDNSIRILPQIIPSVHQQEHFM